MRPALTLPLVAALLCLAGCHRPSAQPSTDGAPTYTIGSAFTASTIMVQLTLAVPTARLTATYTQATDPNHLLGQAHEYASKVEFADSRINGSDEQRAQSGGIDYGGTIEVFATSADAAARADALQSVLTRSIDYTEWDFLHGNVLIRVSQYLTPAQAEDFQTIGNRFG